MTRRASSAREREEQCAYNELLQLLESKSSPGSVTPPASMECERCFHRLLRARRERPRRRTAEKRDELAPSYVEHGGLLPRLAPTPDTRRRWRSAVGLPRTQGITEGTAGSLGSLNQAVAASPLSASQPEDRCWKVKDSTSRVLARLERDDRSRFPCGARALGASGATVKGHAWPQVTVCVSVTNRH